MKAYDTHNSNSFSNQISSFYVIFSVILICLSKHTITKYTARLNALMFHWTFAFFRGSIIQQELFMKGKAFLPIACRSLCIFN